ncbi:MULTISPECIES: hypothetical protein [Clostridium]|uniref:Uncharacterized protein n=1 Tax=Clostridium frigoriphilum TaxID=443253 RepID=A0ABU7UU76_9CLOT|nr:hypothetical protein [Clostridium sp. DSM 17811]MBU3101914.1 hypothetical protein [Clostridium sp. DSM 17811]
MDSKKRMMFILEEDYYFITIKLLAIFKALECYKKPFSDYRKLGLIFEFIKDDRNMKLFRKLIKQDELDIFENEKAVKLFCDSKMDVSIIKRVLFFLEKQEIVSLQKNIKSGNIDVMMLHNEKTEEIFMDDSIKKDVDAALELKKNIRGLKVLKIETLQTKILGYSEVTKWED